MSVYQYTQAMQELMDWAACRNYYTGDRGRHFNPLALSNLTPEEARLYETLLAENGRVEQEKVMGEWVARALSKGAND